MSLKIQWLGHASFYLADENISLVVDPWLSSPTAPKDASFSKLDWILLTHAHGDHIGSALELAKQTGAKVLAMNELAIWFSQQEGIDASKVVGMNIGGTVELKPGYTATMTMAVHSSSIPNDPLGYAGFPTGYVIQTPSGHSIYHAGDTGVFYDMKIIADLYKPTVALLPIGGHYTMSAKEAAYALDNLLHSVKTVIPMHYGTFPVLKSTPDELKSLLQRSDVTVLPLEPGAAHEF